MYEQENELRGLFTRIAVALLFLYLFINLYGGVCMWRDYLVSLYPRIIWLDCVTDILCSFLYFLSFFLPVVIFYAFSKKGDARSIDFSFTLPYSNPFLKTVAVLFVSVGAILAMAHINSWLVPSFPTQESFDIMTQPYQLVLMMFSTAVIPAFSEELLFRGVILNQLKPYGKGMAIVASALLFGLMHMNPGQLLYATAAGLVLGAVYVKTNSLWLCILIHYSNNLFGVLESYIYEILSLQTAGVICMIAELLIFSFAVVFVLLYSFNKKGKQTQERKIGFFGESKPIRFCFCENVRGERYRARAFFSPTMIVYLVLVGVQILSVYFVSFVADL